MPIEKGDVLFDQVESELSELINPGDDTTNVHAQVMEGLAQDADKATQGDDTDDTSVDDTTDDTESDGDVEDTEDDEVDDTDDTDSDDDTDNSDTDDSTDDTSDQVDQEAYKAALDVKAQFDKILENYGLVDLQDLVDVLNEGTDMQDILGDLDLKDVIKSHQTLEHYNKVWAEREAAKKAEDETPEETIKRLEQEKQDLINQGKQKEAAEKQQKDNARLVKEFDNTVESQIEADKELDDDTRTLVRQLMGIGNTNLDINVTDKRTTIKSTQDVIKAIKSRDAKVAQKAIDDYAKGKSKISIKTKANTSASSTAVKKFKLPKDATPEQALAACNNELIEILTQAAP